MAAPMPGVNQATMNAVNPELMSSFNIPMGGQMQVAPQYQRKNQNQWNAVDYMSPMGMLYNSMRDEGSPTAGNWFTNLFRSTPPTMQQWANYNPAQQQAFGQMLQMMMQNIDPRAAEKDIMNQFETQEIPSIAARFAGMGEGMQGSSAFQNALGTTMKNYGQGMAGLRHQMGMGMAPYGFAQQFENVYQPGQQSPFSSLMSNLLPMVGQAAGAYVGGLPMASAIKSLGGK
jgi:hypothetical protein